MKDINNYKPCKTCGTPCDENNEPMDARAAGFMLRDNLDLKDQRRVLNEKIEKLLNYAEDISGQCGKCESNCEHHTCYVFKAKQVLKELEE